MKRSESGITLVELLVVVGILAILLAIAGLGSDAVERQRVAGATRELLADLQRARQDAITRSSGATSRGAGIRFASATSYVTFEFVDADNDYQYDPAPAVEELAGSVRTKTLSGGLSLTLDGADPTGTVIIFDKQGMARETNWAFVPGAGLRFVVQSSRLPALAKCILLNQARIREGGLNGANCVVS
ncbi:MAG: prepilin-type N-terminal cleavage/methylation domain-containing protein [Nitrospirae bacterium]|nr:prepilin-type N-terminal cleavage/methylation domain-containing protein [Nitrospirota bacterium]